MVIPWSPRRRSRGGFPAPVSARHLVRLLTEYSVQILNTVTTSAAEEVRG
jgi:hypothetical protein